MYSTLGQRNEHANYKNDDVIVIYMYSTLGQRNEHANYKNDDVIVI